MRAVEILVLQASCSRSARVLSAKLCIVVSEKMVGCVHVSIDHLDSARKASDCGARSLPSVAKQRGTLAQTVPRRSRKYTSSATTGWLISRSRNLQQHGATQNAARRLTACPRDKSAVSRPHAQSHAVSRIYLSENEVGERPTAVQTKGAVKVVLVVADRTAPYVPSTNSRHIHSASMLT